MKINHRLQVSNTNNSLVYYRALVGRMPTVLEPDRLKFEGINVEIELIESPFIQTGNPRLITVDSHEELVHLFERIRGFIRPSHTQDCQIIGDYVGIEDPDGHRWIIKVGDESRIDEEAVFAKCHTLPSAYN